MGWPHVSMDAVCAGYYAEVSVDQAVSERPEQADGVRAALAPVRNLALLLPSPDPEESVRILTERRALPAGFDWHRHFVTHPSNGALAKLVVYTAGQTPGQTCDALYKGLVRTAS
jgi:hypothetical protein